MIYIITNFDNGFHAEVAIIEADSPQLAKAVLNDRLSDPDVEIGTREIKPESEWTVTEQVGRLAYRQAGGALSFPQSDLHVTVWCVVHLDALRPVGGSALGDDHGGRWVGHGDHASPPVS